MPDKHMTFEIEQLAGLIAQVAEQHEESVAGGRDEDEEWPLWYAERLLEPLMRLFQLEIPLSLLVYLLVYADRQYHLEQPEEEWPLFVALTMQEEVSEQEEEE